MMRGHMMCIRLAVAVFCSILCVTAAFAGFTGTDVFLPSVGAKAGVPPSVWYTTVWVHNPNTTSANVTFYLLERQANPAPLTYTDTIQPGDTAKYENAIQLMFAKQTFGALRLTSNVKVMAGSRIYSQSGELKDSVGQFFAGTPASFAIGAGQTTELLGVYGTQPSTESIFRYNYGFVETTGTGTCEVKVTVRDPTGTQLGDIKTYTLHQWEQMQKAFASEFPALSTQNARLTVEVTSGTGKIIAYGSSAANGSQDPATFEMAFRDELLAENSSSGGLAEVKHDTTLTGTGSTASPLGLANESVTPAKLNTGPLRPQNGQVLTTDGSAMRWRDVDLKLPYGPDAQAFTGSLFGIRNSGVGIGVLGESTGGTGVKGLSSSAAGVEGSSATGIGVRALSHSNVVALQGVNDSQGAGALVIDGWNKTSRVFSVDTGGNTSLAGKLNVGGAVTVSASSATGSDVLSVTNNGTGRALTLWATADTALWANSTTGHAMDARSNSNSAVKATSSTGDGVYGYSGGASGVHGVSGAGDGVLGESNVGTGVTGKGKGNGSGIWGYSAGGNAGYFAGKVHVAGTLTKSAGSFKIDHPLDPSCRYLYHSFVESPDMMNIYNGNVVTDDQGLAIVTMPDWFEALNKDFRYQLTVIGRFAQAIVERKVENNQFTIRTNLANVEVSWQVTGIRKDAFANAHRIPVEEDKRAAERGTYLHPELFGQPEEKGIEWVYRPELMRRLKQEREQATQVKPE